MRLIDFFDQAAARHPERCAFADRGTTFDYAQMRAFSQRQGAEERGILAGVAAHAGRQGGKERNQSSLLGRQTACGQLRGDSQCNQPMYSVSE
jgi:hypothetical protein